MTVQRTLGGQTSDLPFRYGSHSGTCGTRPTIYIIDNADAEFSDSGSWTLSTYVAHYYGVNYQAIQVTGSTGVGNRWAKFDISAKITAAGYYRVCGNAPGGDSSRGVAEVIVSSIGGDKVDTFTWNQYSGSTPGAGAGTWKDLGIYYFDNTGSEFLKITDNGVAVNKYICADCIKLERLYDEYLETQTNEGTDRFFRSAVDLWSDRNSAVHTIYNEFRSMYVNGQVANTNRTYRAISGTQTQANSFGAEFIMLSDPAGTDGVVGFCNSSYSNVRSFAGVYFDRSGSAPNILRAYPQIYTNEATPTSYRGTAIVLHPSQEYRYLFTFEGNGGANSTGQVVLSVYDISGNLIGSQSIDNGAGKSISVDEVGCGPRTTNAFRIWLWDWSAWTGSTAKAYASSPYWLSTPINTKMGAGMLDGWSDATYGAGVIADRVANGAISYSGTYNRVYHSLLRRDQTLWLTWYDLDIETALTNLIYIGAVTGDVHDHASLCFDADGYLHVFYGAQTSEILHAVSDQTESAGIISFTRQADIDAHNYTYPHAYLQGDYITIVVLRHPEGAEVAKSICTLSQSDDFVTATDIAQCNGATGYVVPYYRTDQKSTGEICVGLNMFQDAGAVRTCNVVFLVDTDGTTIKNAAGDTLTKPIYLYPETLATSSDPTFSDPDSRFYIAACDDDEWNGKDLYLTSGAMAGTHYTVADTVSAGHYVVISGVNLAALGVASGDTYILGEKHTTVWINDASQKVGATQSVDIRGSDIWSFFAVIEGANLGQYCAHWDSVAEVWDLVQINADYPGPIGWSNNSTSLECVFFYDNGTDWLLQKYVSSDGGANWSYDSTVHKLYHYDANRSHQRTVVLPAYKRTAKLQMLLGVGSFPQFALGSNINTGQGLYYGSAYPDWIATHSMTQVDWTVNGGSAHFYQGGAQWASGVNDANVTWRDLGTSSPVTDFSSWAELLANCEYTRLKIVPPTSGNYLSSLTITLGTNPFLNDYRGTFKGIGFGVARGVR